MTHKEKLYAENGYVTQHNTKDDEYDLLDTKENILSNIILISTTNSSQRSTATVLTLKRCVVQRIRVNTVAAIRTHTDHIGQTDTAVMDSRYRITSFMLHGQIQSRSNLPEALQHEVDFQMPTHAAMLYTCLRLHRRPIQLWVIYTGLWIVRYLPLALMLKRLNAVNKSGGNNWTSIQLLMVSRAQ